MPDAVITGLTSRSEPTGAVRSTAATSPSWCSWRLFTLSPSRAQSAIPAAAARAAATVVAIVTPFADAARRM